MKKDIITALRKVSREIYKEGERERRGRLYHDPWDSLYQYSHRVTLKEVVFEVIPAAVSKASGGGQYTVSARTLYYQVRPLIQHRVDRELDYTYFSQDLLTQYQKQQGPIKELYYDPRGVLYEPHTAKSIPLGTREVGDYKFPSWLYNKILYIEKKGLWPPLETAKIAERYDMAIIAAEGYATEAARVLFENAERDQDYELYVLHDADPHGYNIARTLRKETKQMPDYHVNVVDLGLFLEEAIAMGLQGESFTRRKALPWGLDLSESERAYFQGEKRGWQRSWVCKRIELNAFTAPALIKYIEEKLKEAGSVGKVIPPDEELSKQAEEVYWEQVSKQVEDNIHQVLSVEKITDSIGNAFRPRIPLEKARHWIEGAFGEDDSKSWRDALGDSLDSHLTEQATDLDKEVKREIRKAIKKAKIQKLVRGG